MKSEALEIRESFLRGLKLGTGIDDDESLLIVLDYLAENNVEPVALYLHMSAARASVLGHQVGRALVFGINPVFATIDLDDEDGDDDAPFSLFADAPAWPAEQIVATGVWQGQDIFGLAFWGSYGPEREWLGEQLFMAPVQDVLLSHGEDVIAFVEANPEPVREPYDEPTIDAFRLQGFLYDEGKVPSLEKLGF